MKSLIELQTGDYVAMENRGAVQWVLPIERATPAQLKVRHPGGQAARVFWRKTGYYCRIRPSSPQEYADFG